MGEPKVSNSSSPISDAIFVERMMAQRESIESKSQGTVSKIPSRETATMQQAAKPETSRTDINTIVQKVLGYSLIGLGGAAGLAFLPVTLPLGVLGAGIGYGIGKGLQALNLTKQEDAGKTGAVIAGGIASLLTGLVVTAGVLLVKDANTKKSDQRETPTAQPKVLDQNELELKELSQLEKSAHLNEPDPDGVKFLLDTRRKELDGSKLATDDLDRDYSFQTNDPQRVNLDSKYDNFFTLFNKEIELKVALKDLHRNRNIVAGSYSEGHARLNKIDMDILNLEVAITAAVDNTNAAYADAVKPNT